MRTDTRSALRPSQVVIIGSMVFGLMFGAGNLIFPVELGRGAGSQTPWATLGFLVTAVGLPVLAIIASALSGSRNVQEMARPVGVLYAAGFTVLLYLAIGPMLAIPRTATVSYEIGLAPVVPAGHQQLGLVLFSTAFFTLTLAAALRPGRLIDWVGRYLTPAFLALLAVLLVAAVAVPMNSSPLADPGSSATQSLSDGFLDGYNTLDALAGLAFAIVIIEAVRRYGVRDRARVAVATAQGGVLAGLAMAAVYGALAFLGATSVGAVPRADNGGAVLAQSSEHYFGSFGIWLIGAIVVLACLKTSIGLVVACGEMFSELFGTPTAYRLWTVGFVLVSWGLSNLGLTTIVEWSVPVLVLLYPLAIVTIVLGLLTPWLGRPPVVHRFAIGFVAVAAVVDFVVALPVTLPGSDALGRLAGQLLPGYSAGFGWVAPALVGFLVGLLVHRLSGGRADDSPAGSAPTLA
ncbi:branched-chain amino acid transport system II carrier protein [Kytococcus sedentarius]|uniref:Branched-chain amino acid uptake carrier n=1 Tax=Kytococcus sedentarius (strain ATCC 14392 / DSM 20547 / JCM 11482 / CCUG 33030 / NBRC 15357 / NCTC 11040 / CCM 314 / 541) TaxID=478801 RepID=C7NHY0_KYTSD|nr:branched-chain amino acid transport system II carrier protein [Kytococcus sedentarius]ACV06487.1 branched-chain amino acid uptake carrier [Kytococcus sedentarius DSM 20547]QQB64802.1 branched-chain amino acid transport system II carrier protein [Kytococcus sedentarius]STX12089.1 LIV-II [Kytococcus sedentarius]